MKQSLEMAFTRGDLVDAGEDTWSLCGTSINSGVPWQIPITPMNQVQMEVGRQIVNMMPVMLLTQPLTIGMLKRITPTTEKIQFCDL